MATSTPTLTLTLALSVLLLLLPLNTSAESFQDFLPMFGLPRGLIPDAVESYSLAADNTTFSVELASTCYARFHDREAYYEKHISGKVSYGKITDLSGVQAKKLFLWVSLTGFEVKPEQDVIEFRAGIISEALPLSYFDEVPACRSSVGACRGAQAVLEQAATAAADAIA